MGLFKKNSFEDGYAKGRADAERDLYEAMSQLSLLNKKFAEHLLAAVKNR